MAKKQVGKISDKIAKVNESFSINMYDNGYMIEIGGNNEDGDWATAKILVKTVDELLALVKEASELPRNE
jgi:hypothetical protein